MRGVFTLTAASAVVPDVGIASAKFDSRPELPNTPAFPAYEME